MAASKQRFASLSAASRNPGPSAFARRVVATVRRIPAGAVATYGDIAEWAGAPRAARAVGSILRECDDPAVPCHRVVAAGGALGGFGSWLHIKRDRLIAEGLDVTPARIRGFADVRWDGKSRQVPLRTDRQATPRRPHAV